MAALIASGNGATDSADVVVAAGTPITLFLVTAAGGAPPSNAVASVQIKSAALQYMEIGQLDAASPAVIIDAPGTYRVSRRAGATFGVDQT